MFCVTEWHGRSQESGEQVDHVPQGPAHVFSAGGQRHWHTLRRAAWVVFSFMCARIEKADLTDSRLTLTHFFFFALCFILQRTCFWWAPRTRRIQLSTLYSPHPGIRVFSRWPLKKKKSLSNSLTDAGGITFVLLLCCCLEIRGRWYIFSRRPSCTSYFLGIWKTHASYFLSRILPIHILYSLLSVIS